MPPTIILPLVGFSSRVSNLNKVDLPAPDGPTIITNSLGSTCKLTRSSADPLRLYVLDTLSRRITTILYQIELMVCGLQPRLYEGVYAAVENFLRVMGFIASS